MFKLTVLIAMIFPAVSHGFFGMLGRDQCAYPQTQMPVSNSDANHARYMQVQELERYRANLDQQMLQVNAEASQLQGSIGGYFQAPWSDTMFAHMDNGLDCCSPTRTSAQVNSQGNRLPAGQDLVDPMPYDASADVTYSQPEVTTPAPAVDTSTSCNGYSSQYCSSGWGTTTYSNPNTSGQLCLQTGFAATPAWYQAACRDGGQIDPQVCSNPRISRNPRDYQRCISALDLYRRNSLRKRQLASQIQEINSRIQALRNPNRPYSGDFADSTYSGETTRPGGNGFLSGLGSFLGGVINTIGPFVLNQYLSYTASKQPAAPTRLGPRQTLAIPNGGRHNYGPGSIGGRGTLGSLGGGGSPYQQPQPQPPPPFYGPNYGYGMSYGGQYGQTLPGYQTGGFGCNTGMLGAGMNLLGMLFNSGIMGGGQGGMGGMLSGLLGGGGNAGLNVNMNANLGGTFGFNGGGAPYAAYQAGYGNSYPGVAPHTMGGFSPPYQPGGIYGGTPAYNPFYNQSAIPNFYTNQPQSMYSPSLQQPSYACGTCGTSQYLGTQHNAFYYSQQLNNQQRMAESDSILLRKQAELDYQLMQLRMMNNGTSNQYNTGTNFQTGYTNGLTGPGTLRYSSTPGL